MSSRLGEDRFRVAGTAEFNGDNRDIRADRIKPLVDWTRRLFPGVDTSRVVPWAGLRPMMPDMMPRVGPGRRPGVFYNTGHGHLGWTLSAATAEIVASAVAPAPAWSFARPLRDGQRERPVRGHDGRELDGRDQTVGPGDALARDVERGAVIG